MSFKVAFSNLILYYINISGLLNAFPNIILVSIPPYFKSFFNVTVNTISTDDEIIPFYRFNKRKLSLLYGQSIASSYLSLF